MTNTACKRTEQSTRTKVETKEAEEVDVKSRSEAKADTREDKNTDDSDIHVDEVLDDTVEVLEEMATEVGKALEKIVEKIDDTIDGIEERNEADTLGYPEEVHLRNVRQLTFGGDNAEAYWSFDNKNLVFQASNEKWGDECDQIYIMDPFSEVNADSKADLVSTGLGRTTCSYYLPGNTTIVYASTHLGDENCPPTPERRTDGKYVWPIYSDFDIFTADLEGNIVNQLTSEAGYDAEATVSPLGDLIVFTSIRTGDLELYTMNIDGSDVKQVTSGLGYDGGAFFSPDGTKLIFRASRPKTNADVTEYKALLAEGLVKPTEMELYICNIDGSDLKKITDLGNANWAPFYHPSGEKIIFSSNHNSTRGFPFNLFMVNVDGTGLEQITFDKTFDSFPMFSFDGKYLVFASNRNNGGTRDTNLFIAEWVD